MEKMEVRELMRLVEEFPRISSQATLSQAVDALERAQEEFVSGRSSQRIMLVHNDAGRIVGKISPMDVVQGLEPNYDRIDSLKNISRYHLGESTLESMKEQYRLWQEPFTDLCKKAYTVKIESFVKMPAPHHIVNADDKMDSAFHLFVVGRHDSLFARDRKEIVGLIMFSDVYRKIVQSIRECPVEA